MLTPLIILMITNAMLQKYMGGPREHKGGTVPTKIGGYSKSQDVQARWVVSSSLEGKHVMKDIMHGSHSPAEASVGARLTAQPTDVQLGCDSRPKSQTAT